MARRIFGGSAGGNLPSARASARQIMYAAAVESFVPISAASVGVNVSGANIVRVITVARI